MTALLAVVAAAQDGISPELPVSWGTATGALALLTVAISFNFANQRSLRRDIKVQKRENVMCNYRTAILVDVLDRNGISVPASFWLEPPDDIARLNVDDQRRRARFPFPFGGEDGKAEVRSVLGFVATFIAAFFVFGLVVNVVFGAPLRELQEGNDRLVEANRVLIEGSGALRVGREVDACVASLTADYFVAIKRALAAPPTPSGERAAALLDLDVTAERIRDRVPICEDGEPDAYAPTPPTP